jgi:Chaperone of endosialidase/Collagen triple helix repeat (20 copies)
MVIRDSGWKEYNDNTPTSNASNFLGFDNSGNMVKVAPAIGLQGIQGLQGIAGIQGLKGDTGLPGATGLTGPQGLQGIKGDIGNIGLTGATGTQGIKGDTGLQGLIGLTGLQGIQGLIGLTGQNGTNGIDGLNGKTVLNGAVPPQLSDGIEGDFYINTSTSTIFGPKTDSGWGTSISLIGATGIQGNQGVQGITGAIGLQGLTGAQGLIGQTGAAGLQGSQGIQGLTGTQGPIGLTGATGLQGIQGIPGIANIQTANNGLTLSGSNLQLGGTLTTPTTFTTSATNTLSITGLQDGQITNNLIVQDTNGTLKTLNSSLIGKDSLQSAYDFTGNGTGNTINLFNSKPININSTSNFVNFFTTALELKNYDTSYQTGTNLSFRGSYNTYVMESTRSLAIRTQDLLELKSNSTFINTVTGTRIFDATPNSSGLFLSNMTNSTPTSTATNYLGYDNTGKVVKVATPTSGGLQTANNGLTLSGSNLELGGTLLQTTNINQNGNNLTLTGAGNLGIGLANPTQKVDIAGNLRLSGAFMPNNIAGTTGQVLTSQGNNLAPTWSNLSLTCDNNWTGGNGYGTPLCIGGNDGGPANPTIIGLKSGAFSYGLFLQTSKAIRLSLFDGFTRSDQQFQINPERDYTGNYIAPNNDSGLTLSQLSDSSPTSTATNYLGFDNTGKVVKVATPTSGGLQTANNGLSPTGSNLQLGGVLTQNTIIDGSSANKYSLTLTNGNLNLDQTNTAGTTGLVNIGGQRFINTKGGDTFVGFGAGNLNSDTTLIARTNSGFGGGAMQSIFQGVRNTASGFNSLRDLTNGFSNSGFGFSAGANITTGSNNLALGNDTNVASSTASYQLNIANNIFGTGLNGSVGSPAGFIGIGTAAPTAKLEIASGVANSSGLKFTSLTSASPTSTGQAIGVDASGNVVTIAGGGGACATCFVNSGNSFGGLTSLGTNDNNSLSLKTNNIEKLKILNTVNANNQILTITGGDALINGLTIGKGSNNSYGNTAIGESALAFNIQGYANTGVGFSALKSNLGSNHNTALGWQALQKVSSSGNNTAVGSGALYNNEGSSNTAIGKDSGQVITTGDNNTLIGYDSNFFGLTTGRANTFIGANISGYSNSLSNNIIIADGDGNKRINVDATGKIGIGMVAPTNKLTVEDLTTTNVAKFNGSASTQCTVETGTGLSCSSDQRLKQGINGLVNATDIIKGLRPVTYQWNGGSETQYGLIAQEVQAILPDLVTTNSDGYLSLSQQELMPFVIKALQETNAKVDANSQGTNITTTSNTFTQPNIFNQTITAIQDMIVRGVTYLQDLVVQGNAIFQGRVEFQDRDMAGVATLNVNTKEIEVTYTKPYNFTPVVNITSLGHRIIGNLKSSNANGFVIEIENPALTNLKFNWTAINVQGEELISSSSTTTVSSSSSVANSSTSSSFNISSSSLSSSNSTSVSSSILPIVQNSSSVVAISSSSSLESTSSTVSSSSSI